MSPNDDLHIRILAEYEIRFWVYFGAFTTALLGLLIAGLCGKPVNTIVAVFVGGFAIFSLASALNFRKRRLFWLRERNK